MRLPATGAIDRLLKTRAALVLSILVAFAALAYLGQKTFFDPINGYDFRYIWLAGRVWGAGQNPYDASFVTQFRGTFGFENGTWAYPPHWLVIAVPLSKLPLEEAALLWRIISAACLIAIWAMALLIFRQFRPNALPVPVRLLLLASIAFLQAVPICLSMGQTSLLITAGAMLFYFGAIFRRSWCIVLGTLILTLKPQLAIVPIVGTFALGLMRREILIGVTTAAAASIPALVIGGIWQTATGFLESIRGYGSVKFNTSQFTTGLPHLLKRAFDIDAPNLLYIAIGVAVTALASLWIKRSRASLAEDLHARTFVVLTVFPALTCFFIPLHDHDAVAIIPAMLVAFATAGPARALMLVGLATAYRSLNSAEALDFLWYGRTTADHLMATESLLLSIAYALVLVGVTMVLLRLPRGPLAGPFVGTDSALGL